MPNAEGAVKTDIPIEKLSVNTNASAIEEDEDVDLIQDDATNGLLNIHFI